MFCDPLDIPDDVLKAQEEGNLVVFAGAGVSRGEPSKLPLFSELAVEIGKRCGRVFEHERKDYDVILGTWQRDDVPVHRLCLERISAANGKYTPVHTHLLRLFRSKDDVRIVTTNFDTHFTTAAIRLGWRLREWYAPALPLGNDFTGIVHLHGSVEDTERRLVLTDDDFGRAYLAEGWARTFVQTLYANRVVVFVGYSHSDVLVTYLARGLTSKANPPRFAICSSDDPQNWGALGVRKIVYEKSSPPDSHANLRLGLDGWVRESSMVLADADARFKRILAGAADAQPTLAGAELRDLFGLTRVDADFLRRWLRKPEGVAMFTRHASDIRWAIWLQKEGFLKRFSTLAEDGDELEQRLVRWAAAVFVRAPIAHAYEVFGPNGCRLGPVAWRTVAHELAYSEDLEPQSESARPWFALLVDSFGPGFRMVWLEALISRLARRSVYELALALFAVALRPVWKLERPFVPGDGESSEPARLQPTLVGDANEIRDIWQGRFLPIVDEIGERMWPIITSCIEAVYQRDLTFDRSFGRDPLIRYRQYIEEQSSLYAPDSVALLVDMLLDLVRWRCRIGSGVGAAQISAWLDSGRSALLRIGLFAAKHDPSLGAAQALEIVKARGLVYPQMQEALPEAKALVGHIFCLGGIEEKHATIALVELGPPDSWFDEENGSDHRDERRKTEVERYLLFLAELAPGAPGISTALEGREIAAPEQCVPDATEDREPEPAIEPLPTVDQLIDKPVSEAVEFLETFVGSKWPKPNRDDLLGATSSAAEKSPRWGISVLKELVRRNSKVEDLWTRLLWRIKYWQLPVDDRLWLFDHLLAQPRTETFTNAVTYFFFGSIRQPEGIEPTNHEWKVLLQFSLECWRILHLTPPEPHKGLAATDYLSVAINRPSGRIVEFWLRYAEHVRGERDQPPTEWPVELQDVFSSMPIAETEADRLGIAVVSTALGFARYIAPTWTRERIYRLMRFTLSNELAYLVWRPWLNHGQFSRDLILEMPPLFEEAAPVLLKADTTLARRFVSFTAVMCLTELFNPIESDWVWRMVERFDPSQREWWNHEISRIAADLGADRQRNVWDQWVKLYWEGRVSGRLGAPKEAEAAAFCSWPLSFAARFTDALQLLKSTAVEDAENFDVMYALKKSDIVVTQPESALEYLLFILQKTTRAHFADDHVTAVVQRAPVTKATIGQLREIINHMIRLEMSDATELLREINAKAQHT